MSCKFKQAGTQSHTGETHRSLVTSQLFQNVAVWGQPTGMGAYAEGHRAASSWFSLSARMSEYRWYDNVGHFPRLFLCIRHVFLRFFNLPSIFLHGNCPTLMPCDLVGLSSAACFPGRRSGHLTGYAVRYPIPLKTMVTRRADVTQAGPESFEGAEAGRDRAAVLASGISCCEDYLILKTPTSILRPPTQSVWK